MLNIYDGILKKINPKLYNSLYMVNINEVRQVLNNFRFRSRLSFMKNLLTLDIKEMDEELSLENFLDWAVYIPCENNIYFDVEADNEVVNHELFHVASCYYNHLSNVNNNGIVNISDEISCINEGITEYFSLKSKKKYESILDYQLELFIVEILVFIYGEEILRYYFDVKSLKFYKQFGEYDQVVSWINICLNRMVIKQVVEEYRLDYLLFLELFPDKLSRDNIDEFKLEENTLTSIQNFYYENSKLYSKFNELVVEKDIVSFNYNYSDINKRYYDRWEMEYIFKVNRDFVKLIKKLMIMAYSKGIDKEELRSFILSSYNHKDKRFKQVYAVSLNRVLEFNNKKIYTRGR